jgi:hypothetical protein
MPVNPTAYGRPGPQTRRNKYRLCTPRRVGSAARGSRGVRLLLASLSLFGALLASSSPALAATVSEFGGQGSRAGEFEEPRGVAVFQETGDIYLADSNNSRVDSFGPEGAFRFAFGWGVRDGKHELETCTASCKAGVGGSGAGEFSSPRAVAIDNNPKSSSYGDLYVVDSGNARVQKFDAEGQFLLTFGTSVNQSTKDDICTSAERANCGAGEFGFAPGGFSLMGGGIVIANSGAVFVGDFNRAEKFTSEGTFELEWPIGEGFAIVNSLAVTESKEILLLAEGVTGIHRYSEAGVEVGSPFDTAGSPQAMTLGPSSEVFVDEHEDGEISQPHLVEYDSAGTEISAFDIGTEGGSRGIAFGGSLDRLYVLNARAVRIVAVPPPGPFTSPGSEVLVDAKPSEATVGAVIVAEGSPTTYRFEYGETTAYSAATTPVPLSEEGGLFAAEPVQAKLTGLRADTVYHFRTATTTAKGETTFGPDAMFRTTPAVLISGESVTQVTPESARLTVELNPQGAETKYHFEYGVSTAYEESTPVPDASAGEADANAAYSVVIEHLAAGTVYHYRVVATNSFGTGDGPDRVFTTTTAPGGVALADGRVWEMVAPPTKHGASLEGISEEGGLIEAAEDGSALAYFGTGPVGSEAEPEGSQNIVDSQFVATRRGPGTWETKDITTPHDRPAGFHPGKRAEYLFFSGDVSTGAVEPFGETKLSTDATERTPYLRELAGGYTPMVTAGNVPVGTKFGGTETGGGSYVGGLELVGASSDAKTTAISSPLALTSDLATPEGNEQRSIYRWSAATRTLQLVSWLPGAPETPAVQSGDRASLGADDVVVRHAVSSDGNRFVYEVETPSGGKHLFLRDLRLGKSVQLDAREDGVLGGGRARFQDASADGRVVYFTDSEQLTVDATGNSNEEGGRADLFRCEVLEVASNLDCKLADVSVPIGPTEIADVRGHIVGTDESGDLVYFVANGRLAPGAVAGNCPSLSQLPAATTTCNLFVYDGATGETRLVAVLSGRDFPDWGGEAPDTLEFLSARVSPNGRYLAFMSQRSLTGYDNRDARSGAADEEVFEYDFQRAQLTCVSCGGTGARPSGVFDSGAFPGLLVDRPKVWRQQWVAANVPGWTSVSASGEPVRAAYQSRYLANDGRVFFNSSDNLVPSDVNGQFDVYEFEPAATGSCGPSEPCVALMSSGQDGGESAFLDADNEGSNVFFLTAAKLSPRDTDALPDVYDAHVCTAASDCPAAGSGAPPPCETSDACRAAPSPQPDTFGAPSSSTFSGAGNLTPPGATTTVKAKPLTRARLLANALKACHKDRAKKQRVSCERKARRRYGPPQKARKAGHTITTRKGGR